MINQFDPKAGQVTQKKPYRRPVLTKYGDIRTKTLCPTTTSAMESGDTGVFPGSFRIC